MKPIKINKVLIALDYDETAQKVAEVGFAVAQAMNAETILLHVINEQPVYYSSYTYMRELSVNVLGDMKVTTQHFLDKTKKHLGDENIKTVVNEGEISEMVLKAASELKVDMIVMGSHSRKWLENILLGSVAADVLKKSTVPMFIVPTKKRL